jgi:hypothetical protein
MQVYGSGLGVNTGKDPAWSLSVYHSWQEQPIAPGPPGRPRTSPEIEDLVVRLARENSGWSYDRIVGALANLGYQVSDQTVGNILRRHGIAPVPERNGLAAAFPVCLAARTGRKSSREALFACNPHYALRAHDILKSRTALHNMRTTSAVAIRGIMMACGPVTRNQTKA